MKIWIDGEYYDESEAKISVFDHGLLYGDGIFEGIRIYSGRAFKLAEHLVRLRQSAKALMLDIGLTPDELASAIDDAIKVNEKIDGYIRLVVTRGKGSLGISPKSCKKSSIIIIVGDISLYPADYYINGIAVVTVPTRRISADSLEPRIKSLNYLNNILAKIEADNAGCPEAVMLNREGFIAECSADNIALVKDNTLLIPGTTEGALDGITINTIIEIAKAADYPVRITRLSRYDLYTADECFLTGTGAEIIPVIKADGRIIGNGKPGPVTLKLTENFHKYVREA